MRLLKALLTLGFVFVVLGAAAAGAGWLWFQNEIEKPGPVAEETLFEVRAGDHVSGVAQRLEEQGLYEGVYEGATRAARLVMHKATPWPITQHNLSNCAPTSDSTEPTWS